jgi:uncharacterized membrane protein
MSTAGSSVETPQEKETGRVEAFSDGVFAIAITLLILEIRVPHSEQLPEGTRLLDALLEQWPAYIAYIISFVIIGIMWVNHHNLFKYIKRCDTVFLFLNGLLLMSITLVNFSTALLADYLQHPDAQVASLVYAGISFFIAVFYNLLWRYASYNNRLLDRNTDSLWVQRVNREYLFGPLFYFIAFLLAFVSVWFSLFIQFALAVFFAVTAAGQSPRWRVTPSR